MAGQKTDCKGQVLLYVKWWKQGLGNEHVSMRNCFEARALCFKMIVSEVKSAGGLCTVLLAITCSCIGILVRTRTNTVRTGVVSNFVVHRLMQYLM